MKKKNVVKKEKEVSVSNVLGEESLSLFFFFVHDGKMLCSYHLLVAQKGYPGSHAALKVVYVGVPGRLSPLKL